MPEPKPFPVFDAQGRVGTLYATARFLDKRSERVIRLETGEEILVPAEALEVRPDGSFFLKAAVNEFTKTTSKAKFPEAPAVQPLAGGSPLSEEGHAVEIVPESSRAVETPVNGNPKVSHVRIPDEQLFRDAYDIERVAVERILDGPVTQRQEGDTLILPVVEEVFVYEKKLMLREEIRITPRKERVAEARTIELGKGV